MRDVVPDFELADSTGVPARLSALAACGRLVVLFYRGFW
jgi:peroxiredoxin